MSMSTEDPKEPAQTVCPVQPPGQVPSSPDSVPVEELIGDHDTLLNGHSNLFVSATADPDQQVNTLHASNGTVQQVEHNGKGKSELQISGDDLNVPIRAETLLETDGVYDFPNNTQSWHVFSHKISVKTGFPDSES